jgi:WD40 repeat protein
LARRLSRVIAHRALAGAWQTQCFTGHTGPVYCVAWSPDGRTALTAGADRALRLWEVATGRCRRTFEGHTESVQSVAWSPDGRCALSAGYDHTVRLWEVASGRCLHVWRSHGGVVYSVVWSPDGRFALAGGEGGYVLRLWDVSSGRGLRAFHWEVRWAKSVAWSPDGRFALSGGSTFNGKNMVWLWDIASGRCLHTYQGHQGSVNAVAWSPDGRFALSGSADRMLRLWHVVSGRCVREFRGHESAAASVAWSPDGRFALSANDDLWGPGGGAPLVIRGAESFRLWEIASGSCLRTFEGHAGVVRAVAWSPDGCFALSAGDDATVRLWELDWELAHNPPAGWVDRARPYLQSFLSVQTPCAARLPDQDSSTDEELIFALTRQGRPTWTDADFHRLLTRLRGAGFGSLDPRAVRRELERMAACWQGPPPLTFESS